MKIGITGATGHLGRLVVNKLKEKVLALIANIEVNIDYPEYEDAVIVTNDLIIKTINEVKDEIEKDYIFVKVDMDESLLPFDLQKVYKKITPSFFFVSKEGAFITQYPGSWTKSDFLEILKENKIK